MSFKGRQSVPDTQLMLAHILHVITYRRSPTSCFVYANTCNKLLIELCNTLPVTAHCCGSACTFQSGEAQRVRLPATPACVSFLACLHLSTRRTPPLVCVVGWLTKCTTTPMKSPICWSSYTAAWSLPTVANKLPHCVSSVLNASACTGWQWLSCAGNAGALSLQAGPARHPCLSLFWGAPGRPTSSNGPSFCTSALNKLNLACLFTADAAQQDQACASTAGGESAQLDQARSTYEAILRQSGCQLCTGRHCLASAGRGQASTGRCALVLPLSCKMERGTTLSKLILAPAAALHCLFRADACPLIPHLQHGLQLEVLQRTASVRLLAKLLNLCLACAVAVRDLCIHRLRCVMMRLCVAYGLVAHLHTLSTAPQLDG